MIVKNVCQDEQGKWHIDYEPGQWFILWTRLCVVHLAVGVVIGLLVNISTRPGYQPSVTPSPTSLVQPAKGGSI